MAKSNDAINTDVVVDPMASISTKEAGITRTDCWEKYAELLTNDGNENEAVRSYLVWLMEDERTKANFNKIFSTSKKDDEDENRQSHVAGLKSDQWLTDEDMNIFAASLGFSLTYVLQHNSHIPPYVSPASYAGFSVADNAPNAVVINSSNTHWRPFEHDVPGDGNCGAYTLASIARRFAPVEIKQEIKATTNSAKWTTVTFPSENHNLTSTYEEIKESCITRDKSIEWCIKEAGKLDKEATTHAEAIKNLLSRKTPEELIQILSKAKIAAGDKKTDRKDNNAQWLNGGAAEKALKANDQTELIRVLTIEAKNTFHDPKNTFFRQLLKSSAKDSTAIPGPLQQQKMAAIAIQNPAHPKPSGCFAG